MLVLFTIVIIVKQYVGASIECLTCRQCTPTVLVLLTIVISVKQYVGAVASCGRKLGGGGGNKLTIFFS